MFYVDKSTSTHISKIPKRFRMRDDMFSNGILIVITIKKTCFSFLSLKNLTIFAELDSINSHLILTS